MNDEEFEAEFGNDMGLHYPHASYGRLRQVAKRARDGEQQLKDQILVLFDYLVRKHPLEMFNDNAHSACKTAIDIMENQSTTVKLYDRLTKLFKEETDILKLDRNKLLDLIKNMKSICLQ